MTTPQERLQRYRDNLIAFSQDKPLAIIAAELLAAQGSFLKQLAGVTPAQASFKASPTDWSISEIAAHVCLNNARLRQGLQDGLAGQDAAADLQVGGNPEPLGDLSLVQADHAETIRLLDDLAARPGLDLTMRLSPFGVLDSKAALFMLFRHTSDHTNQIANVKAAEGFPKELSREERLQMFKDRLVAQVAGQSLSDLAAQVTSLQDSLVQSVTGLSASQVAFKPSPNDWSIEETVAHIIQSNLAVRKGLRAALANQELEIDASGHDDIGPIDVLASVREDRADTASILEGLCSRPGLAGLVRLKPFGEMDCKTCLAFLLYHASDHVKQVANIRSSAGFPQS